MVGKRSFLVLLFGALFFIAGCYDVHIKHEINSDGSSSVEVLFNFEEMLGDMDEEMQGGDFSEACDGFNPEEYGMLDAECEVVGEYELLVNGRFAPGVLDITGEEGVESFLVKSAYPLLGFVVVDGSGGFEDGESLPTETVGVLDDSYLESLSDMPGVSHTYEVVLPGEVIESDVGSINGNVVVIDMFDLPGVVEPVITFSSGVPDPLPSPTIESDVQGTDTIVLVVYALIGIIGVSAVGFLVFYLSRNKEDVPEKKLKDPDNYLYRKTSAPADNYTVNQLVDWIHVYEKKFPDSILKDVLRKHGHREEDIEEAFKRR